MYELISREGKIKERLEIATILNKCIAELISGEDEDAAISNLLRIISGYFDGDRSYIVQIDEKRNVCTNTYEYAMNGVTAEKDNLQEVPMEMLVIRLRTNGRPDTGEVPRPARVIKAMPVALRMTPVRNRA